MAASDGGAQRVAVEQVGLAQHQPLCRAGEAPQVRVLRVICMRTQGLIKTTSQSHRAREQIDFAGATYLGS